MSPGVDGGGLQQSQAEGHEDLPEEEETTDKRVSADPGQPTRSEREDHNVDHTPYRSWCEECVRGRATGEQHRATGGVRSMPVISMDYLFVTQGQILRRSELEGGDDDERFVLKVLVVKDSKTKAVFAHAVDKKGADADGYAVSRIVEDIRWLGHTRIALKADNERAIVKLLRESLKAARTDIAELEQVQEEFPSAYDSQSNGSIENAIRNFQGLMRTMKLGLERRLNVKIPHSHPLMSWLAEHVAWTQTMRHKHADGMTAYERVKGTAWTRKLLEFGEKALFKLPVKGPRHDLEGKLAERWSHGHFLGFARSSNEYIFWTEDGAVKARSQMRLSLDRRWPSGELEQVNRGAHSAYAPRIPDRFLPGDDAPEPPAAEKRAAQAVQIRKADWEAHGSTPGCSKCIHADMHGWGKAGGPHSTECVERFRQFFSETEAGRARLQREADRQRVRPGEEGGDGRIDPIAAGTPPSRPAGTPLPRPPMPPPDHEPPHDVQQPAGSESDGDDVAMGGKEEVQPEAHDEPMGDESAAALEPIM